MTDNLTVVINGYEFGNRGSGVKRNATELIAELDAILSNVDTRLQFLLAVPEITPLTPHYKNISCINLKKPHNSKFAKIAWRSIFFPNYVSKSGGIGLDLTLAFPGRGKFCVFDYDCILEDNSQSYFEKWSALRLRHYMNRVRKSLDGATLVFTDSEYAKSQLISHYGCDAGKMHVIPCAWQHMLRVQQDDTVIKRLGLEDKAYFFSLGSRYPYKNFRWVECAAQQNPQYQFVVTGLDVGTNDGCITGKLNNLMYTGYLSDEEMKGLMAHCKAFLHPSFDEGFGIPPLEAMSVGADCVISSAGALPEVYGNSVRYIDPGVYDNIDMDAILAIPTAGTKQDALDRYSWKKSAEMVLRTIESRCFA